MSDRILVVETGGTFATSSVNAIRSLADNPKEKKIYDYDQVKERLHSHKLSFDIVRPIYTLSENMTFDKLNALLYALWSVDYSKYKGVIITHGTDTMAYTANLLSMLFSHWGIPILLVSSNHPLSHEMSNGVENFVAAIDFIASVEVQGVYVVYRSHYGDMEIHLGSRIKQMNQIIDAYESFKNSTFGKMVDGEFMINSDKHVPSIKKINEHKSPVDLQTFPLGKRILLIYPYVGLRYDYFNLNESVDAVVCGVYHSGTVCVEDHAIDQSINTLLDKAEKLNIPVFIGELSSEHEHYASFDEISKSPNFYPVYDISLENLYVKAHIALASYNSPEEWVNYINNTNIFFEKILE